MAMLTLSVSTTCFGPTAASVSGGCNPPLRVVSRPLIVVPTLTASRQRSSSVSTRGRARRPKRCESEDLTAAFLAEWRKPLRNHVRSTLPLLLDDHHRDHRGVGTERKGVR